MAIDTRDKRANCLLGFYQRVLPDPDIAAETSEDRRQMAYVYRFVASRINSRNRRAGCLGIDAAYRIVYPDPDGSLVNQNDRMQSVGKYPYLDIILTSGIFRNRTASRLRIFFPNVN